MTRTNRFRHLVLALAFILLFVCLGQIANAATGTAAGTWTRPTAHEDASPLAASAITGYALTCEFTPTGGASAACASFTPATFAGTATSGTITVSNLPATGGQLCLTLSTVTSYSRSAPSPAQCKAVDPVKPNAPSNFTITVTVAINLQSDSEIRVAVADPVVTRSP